MSTDVGELTASVPVVAAATVAGVRSRTAAWRTGSGGAGDGSGEDTGAGTDAAGNKSARTKGSSNISTVGFGTDTAAGGAGAAGNASDLLRNLGTPTAIRTKTATMPIAFDNPAFGLGIADAGDSSVLEGNGDSSSS